MELVNESPPTGVLSKSIGNTAVYTNNSTPTTNSYSSNISSRSSNSSTSSVLGTTLNSNQTPTKLSQLNKSKDLNSSSTNNLNIDLNASTFGLELNQTTATTLNNCGGTNNLNTSSSSFSTSNLQHQQPSSLNCANSNSSNNVLNSNHHLNNLTNLNNFNNLKHQSDFLSSNQCEDNYLNCDNKSDLNFNNNLNSDYKFDKLGDLNINSLNSLNCINSINSLQQKSSSLSSSQNNSSAVSLSDNFNYTQPTNQLLNNHQLYSTPNLNQLNHLNQLNQLNNQQKVKRTRQRVDAGEPRNSYASISNYASNRLAGGKASNKFQQQLSNHLQKGLLLDQLGLLGLNGLNALLSSGQLSLDELLLNSNLSSNQNSISLLASLADKQSPNLTDACSSPKLDKLNNQMILNQSFNWNTSANQFNNQSNTTAKFQQQQQPPQQQPNQQSALSAGANLEQSASFVDQTMAKSRFSEDAVTLPLDYNVKVSKNSEFADTEPAAPEDNSMTNHQMDSNEDQIKMEQQLESTEEMQIEQKLQINDENDKNTENNLVAQLNKSPQEDDANSRSESVNSSRCSSPAQQDDEQMPDDEELNDQDGLGKEIRGNRVDNIANNLNLFAERINSNSSCNSTTSTAGSLNSDKLNLNKMNGNCKNRRKSNQPVKTAAEEDEEAELNEMNQLDDKDDLYKDELDDCIDNDIDDYSQSTGPQQHNDDIRKKDFEKLKANFDFIMQQMQQGQNNPFNQLNNPFNAINTQLNSNNQLNNSNSANLRSTRVSDRGRLNGQINSSNNSANSTPVNLSINSPKLDDEERLECIANLAKNQELYNDAKDLFNNIPTNLYSLLCKEFTVLIEDLKNSCFSRKLINQLQDKLRISFDQSLNNADADLEQFFTSTKEHLINQFVTAIDAAFQRYKMKVFMQNLNGTFNLNQQINNLNNLNNLNQFNQSSKNLMALNKSNSKPQQPQRKPIENNNLRANNNSASANLVDQLSSRLQRSSPNLLAGLNNLDNLTNPTNLATSKLLQNLNLNSSLQSNNLLGNSDFKAPFSTLQDNFFHNLLQQQQQQAEEQMQLQNKLQKENQQDSALSLIAPKRKRIKASDEPRRTRTSNRLPNNNSNNQTPNSLNQINSLSSFNLGSMTPKSTQELLANLVSRDFNNTTPLHNLNQSANASSLSLQNNQNDLDHDTPSNNNQSTNSSAFPFNGSFMNGLNVNELDQLMLAVNNGLSNGLNNNLTNGLNGQQQTNSNRASPLSSYGNLSSGQFMLDQSPDNSMSNNDLDGAESTTTLSPVHLRKAKLMFFYVRYPSSNVLKTFFRDIKFNKNNTAQLVKWFSNFREFYYQQIDKYARQELSNGRENPNDIHVPSDSELLKVLNVHYNRQNHISVPESFRAVVEETVRQFFISIKGGKDDSEPSWRKPIYKIIARLDTTVPECFRQPNFLEALENNYNEN